MEKFPDGVVRLVSSSTPHDWSEDNIYPIYDLSCIYKVLGASPDDFLDWQNKYGMDSLGRNPRGLSFLPRFPTFSKVAWMHIDPVLLSGMELDELVRECEDAIETSESHDLRDQFKSILTAAKLARYLGVSIEFGHY